MTIPSRMKDRALVISEKKQTDYATVVTDANLQAGKRFEVKAPVFGQPAPAFWTNRDSSMKGHDYATERREIEREISDQLQFDGDSWLLAWVAAFAMGNVSSVQPNAGGNPTAWDHTIKPLDPAAAGKDLPVTTIYTEVGNVAGLSRRLHSCALREFGIEFPPAGPLQLSASIVGSGEITSGVLPSQPTLSSLILPLAQDLKFEYGPQGAPVDISTEIVRGSVRFGFGWGVDDENARAPGGGLFRSRAWVGTPAPTLEFQRYVDDAASTPHDDFIAGTVQEVKITCEGPQIATGPEKHKIEIRGLAVIPNVVSLGQQGDKTVYQYTIAPEHWLKEGAADVLTIIVTNTQTEYLTS